jgi:acyl-CoA synthetase (AMP-forming)/AMP-acid ligase II
MFDGYSQHWLENTASSVLHDGRRFHRTGDMGYLSGGVLFHLGRHAHVITSSHGPLASVAVEEQVRNSLGLEAAAVGVGPVGAQVLVIVTSGGKALKLATSDTAEAVRRATDLQVAAVLQGTLPLDRRHRSKIDRSALGRQASDFLAGR